MFKNITMGSAKAPVALTHDQMVDAILAGSVAASDLQAIDLLDLAAEVHAEGGDIATIKQLLDPNGDNPFGDGGVVTALEALNDEHSDANTNEASPLSRKQRIKRILLVYGGAAAAIALCSYIMHKNAQAIDAEHAARLDAMRESMSKVKFKLNVPKPSAEVRELSERLAAAHTTSLRPAPAAATPALPAPKAPSTALTTIAGQGVKDHLRPDAVSMGHVPTSRSDKTSAAVAELAALSEKARALNELNRVNINAVSDARTRKTLASEWAAYKDFANSKTKLAPRPISDRRVSGVIMEKLNQIKHSLEEPADAKFSSREDFIDHLSPKDQSLYLGMMQKIALEHKRLSDATLAVIKSLH